MSCRGGLLVVTPRLSLQGGAHRYLLDVLDAVPGAAVRVLFGHRDETAGPLERRAAVLERLAGLSHRVPHRHDARTVARLLEVVEEQRPRRVILDGVQSPAVLAALAGREGTLCLVHDHRSTCPAAGKALPDGSPCREPFGAACDRCHETPDGVDARARDRGLALVAARRAGLARSPTVVVPSRYLRSELVAAGLGAERVRVVPPLAAEWALGPALDPAEGDSIAVVGRIAEHKGCLHLLRALARERVLERAVSSSAPPRPETSPGREASPRPGSSAEVVFVGSGPAERALLDEAARLGLQGRVRITGWLEDGELRAALRGVRAVALPSLWMEPFGMSGVEAGLLGLPVVAHDVGGVREWLEPGLTGTLVPPADGAALARQLARLLRDPDLARRSGARARARLLETRDPARFQRAWRELLAAPCPAATSAGARGHRRRRAVRTARARP